MLAVAILCFSAFSSPLETIEIKEMLVIGSLGSGGRVPITTDVMRAELVAGNPINPQEGDTMSRPNGNDRTWKKIEVAENGWFSDGAFRGGYGYASFNSDEEKVMMLEASGHAVAYANGKPRGGDPYAFGFSRYPVLVKKGRNELLFKVSRGRVRAKLVDVEEGVFLERRDSTLPDFMVGEDGTVFAGVIITNATTKTVNDLTVTTRVDEGTKLENQGISIPPLMSIKVPLHIDVPLYSEAGVAELSIITDSGFDGSVEVFEIPIREAWEQHKRTFISDVDGSVQYYAVKPPFKDSLNTADAIVLTVHGAGVEATGQAAAYGSKSWAWIVAATNRRPYGFDWEDWGRIDALEVLADAKKHYKPREDRIYLTGHSMGGHGAWYLGATHPDQWGAIGPAAGWISFWTYGGAVRYEDPDPIEAMMLRVSNPSDTTKILRNYLHLGVFVLHGDADTTVPVSQPRQMREYLSEFHRDVDWYEHPGGGHWYDSTPEPGADCVDFGPMFEFFDKRRRQLSYNVRRVEFHTTHPGASAKSHWMTINTQLTAFEPSSVVAINPIGTNRFEIETDNVSRLKIDLSIAPLRDFSEPIDVVINSEEFKNITPSSDELTFEFDGSKWVSTDGFNSFEKKPSRAGPFKAAFDNRFVLVYGTTGNKEENAWSLAKARYDAETWSYRGNGHARVVADNELFRGSSILLGNIIAYGNEDTNRVIKNYLKDSPARITSSIIQIGGKKFEQDDLSIMMVRPMSNGPLSIAIVGGTGIKGMRGTDTMPYFVSGVHYPDVLIYDSRIHTIGSKAVQVAGIFGTDWSVANGDFVFRDDTGLGP